MPTKKKKAGKKRTTKKRSSTFFYTLVGLFILSVSVFYGVRHTQSTQEVAGVTAPLPTPTPNPCIGLGDINIDGTITAVDSLLAQKISLNLPKSTGVNYTFQEKRRADVNRNGTVNAQDIVLIQRKIAGLDLFFPGCAPTIAPTRRLPSPTTTTYRTPTPTRFLYPTLTPTKGIPFPTITKSR